jgi:hypothetical protein
MNISQHNTPNPTDIRWGQNQQIGRGSTKQIENGPIRQWGENKKTTFSSPPPSSLGQTPALRGNVLDRVRLGTAPEKKDGFIKSVAKGLAMTLGFGAFAMGMAVGILGQVIGIGITALTGGTDGFTGAATAATAALTGLLIGKLGTSLMSLGGMDKDTLKFCDKAVNLLVTWPFKLCCR